MISSTYACYGFQRKANLPTVIYWEIIQKCIEDYMNGWVRQLIKYIRIWRNQIIKLTAKIFFSINFQVSKIIFFFLIMIWEWRISPMLMQHILNRQEISFIILLSPAFTKERLCFSPESPRTENWINNMEKAKRIDTD